MDPVTSDALWESFVMPIYYFMLSPLMLTMHQERDTLYQPNLEYLSFGKPILAIGGFVASMRHLRVFNLPTQPEVEITRLKGFYRVKISELLWKAKYPKIKKDHNKKSLEKNIRRAFSKGINQFIGTAEVSVFYLGITTFFY